MHDVGKAITVANHGAISAEMIKPYVRDDVYQMIRVHQDFQGKHYYQHFGADPNARETHRDTLTAEQFARAAQFAVEWDQIAFDTDYDTLPLSHFEPLVRKLTVGSML
jgi:predicted HD phosphohydrolase